MRREPRGPFARTPEAQRAVALIEAHASKVQRERDEFEYRLAEAQRKLAVVVDQLGRARGERDMAAEIAQGLRTDLMVLTARLAKVATARRSR